MKAVSASRDGIPTIGSGQSLTTGRAGLPSDPMRIGAHMSVAGGVSRAVERAVLHGCEALQIFCKNANQWLGKPINQHEIVRFRQRVDETGLTPVVSHASYLINLA